VNCMAFSIKASSPEFLVPPLICCGTNAQVLAHVLLLCARLTPTTLRRVVLQRDKLEEEAV